VKSFKGRGQIARNLLVLTGIAILLWSGLEDRDARGVTALGFLSAASFTLYLLTAGRGHRWSARRRGLSFAMLSGALIGAMTALASALLMLFKNLRHGHLFPDYPLDMLLATLERLPYWALAGALAGLGIGLLIRLRAAENGGPH